MSLRIRDNSLIHSSLRNLNDIQSRSDQSVRKISTADRINQSKTDAAGLAISERLRTQINGSLQASRNAQDGISLLQVAEGGLSVINDLLQRGRTLAVQAANDTLTDSDRSNVQEEISDILEEIDRQTETVKFNDRVLLDGSDETLTMHIGADQNDSIDITLPEVSVDSLGLTGATVATRSDAEAAITSFGNAVSTVSDSRTQLGAQVNRLTAAFDFLGVQGENQSAANSRIRDTDFGETAVELTQQQILLQSSQSALAQASVASQSVLTLLGG